MKNRQRRRSCVSAPPGVAVLLFKVIAGFLFAGCLDGCIGEGAGLDYPPGAFDLRQLSALDGDEDRMHLHQPALDETGFSFTSLFSHEKSETGDYCVTNVLYPFYSYRRRANEKEFALRPLFYCRIAPHDDRADAWFLYPLGRYSRTGKSRRLRLMPLFYYNRMVHAGRELSEVEGHTPGDLSEFEKRRMVPGETVDVDWFLFPLLYGGTDPEEGRYFAFLPFGGRLNNFLGKDWIRFVLFPLYMETQDPRYHSWNVLWPVFAWWRGEGQRGWKFFPFYGTNRREGRFERTWFLWPIGYRWRVGLDTKYPTTLFALLPFYGHIRNEKLNLTTVLWPLFSKRTDARRNLVEWHAPWPFFSYTRGDGIRGMKFWPVWGHRSGNHGRRVQFLWPMYSRSLARQDDRSLLTRSVGGVYWQWTEKWRDYEVDGKIVRKPPPRIPGKLWRGEDWIEDDNNQPPVDEPELANAPYKEYERTFWKLWPLCHARRGADDSRVFQFLSPLPWREGRGAANMLSPLWTVYRYERDAEGRIREHALLGLYRHVRDRTQRRLDVLGIYQYRRVGWYYRYAGILGGLVAYERVGYDKGFRLLWIPINPIAREQWDRFHSGAFEEVP